MSVESISIALHHSRATGAAKLVLIGIANHDGDGGAWPSVATLSRYAGVDRRGVQRAISKLEALHEVRRFVQAGGDHRVPEHQRPNRYQFTLKCPPDCDHTSRHRVSHEAVELPIEELSTRAAEMTPRVTTTAPGAALAPPKPSLNHPNPTSKETHVGERARGACGHLLIDDRHCERGCAAVAVEGTAA